MSEIGIQKLVLELFAIILVDTAADEVCDVFHTAPAADVLKVDGCDAVAILRETKISQFCIAVHKGLEWTFV